MASMSINHRLCVGFSEAGMRPLKVSPKFAWKKIDLEVWPKRRALRGSVSIKVSHDDAIGLVRGVLISR